MQIDPFLAEPFLPLQTTARGTLTILYEHPAWFEKLFAELDRREIPYAKVFAPGTFFDPGYMPPPGGVLFNRMSPSAYKREHGSGIFYTLAYLGAAELSGVRVLNGSQAYRYELSKALQLSLLQSLRLPFPAARVIHDPRDAAPASEGLRFPVVVKPNIGGSGAGVVRFDSRKALVEAAEKGQFTLGYDQVGLVQEFIPARGGHITRVETLGGRFLYAIKVHLSGETFDLCPADICQTAQGESLHNACVVEAAKAGLKVEGYQPPHAVTSAIETIVQKAGIDVGGIEYVIDDRDGQLYYYDINALSNFVADAPRVIGFDPFVRLVDFLLQELQHA